MANWQDGALAIDQQYAEQRGVQVGDKLAVNVSQEIPRKAVANPTMRELTVVAIIESDTWLMPRVLVPTILPGASDRLRMVYANVAPEHRESARARARDATMSLVNTVVNGVNERRREFALLRAVGATPVQVRNQVLLEAGLLGLAGGLVGVTGGAVLGAGTLWGLGSAWGGIRLPGSAMAGGLVVSLVLDLVAAIGPARGVMATAPAEAWRRS